MFGALPPPCPGTCGRGVAGAAVGGDVEAGVVVGVVVGIVKPSRAPLVVLPKISTGLHRHHSVEGQPLHFEC